MIRLKVLFLIVIVLLSMSAVVPTAYAQHRSFGTWTGMHRENGITGAGTWGNGMMSGQLSDGRIITGMYGHGEAHVSFMTSHGMDRRHFDYNDCRFRSYGWGIRGSYC